MASVRPGHSAYEPARATRGSRGILITCQKIIDINEEDAPGRFNLGLAYFSLGDESRAEEEWRKAIRFEDKVQRARETTRVSNDKLQVSLVVFESPISFRAMSLAKMYKKQWRFEEAIKNFEKAVDLELGDPEPHYELGKLYLLEADKKKPSFISTEIFI